VALQREDPLHLQMDHFIRVIQGLDAPLVSAHDGLENLRVVEAIAQAAATQQSVLL
jgi:predicted dehydrogenase